MPGDDPSGDGTTSVKLDEERPRVFFLAGISQLILRELQIALTKKVLDQLKALEANSSDWWREGVLPYLNDQDKRDLLIAYYGKEGKAKDLDDVKHVDSLKGKEWFETGLETDHRKKTPKSRDVSFLLRYMKHWSKDKRKYLVWELLFESYGEYPRTPLDYLYEFRHTYAHPEWEELTRPQAQGRVIKAINRAQELLGQLRLWEHKRAIQNLRVSQILREVEEGLQSDFIRGRRRTDRKIRLTSVAALRDDFRSGDIRVLYPQEQFVTVAGTFAPRLLLTRYQDLRKPKGAAPESQKASLQQWLFKGFTDWAPSWDPRVSDENETPRLAGQLASGDEGQSFCVVLLGKHVKAAENLLKSKDHAWGGDQERKLAEPRGGCGCFEVELTGRLRYQVDADVLGDLLIGGPDDPFLQCPDPADRKKLACIVVDDNDKCKFDPTGPTESYTGYLWKCIAPVGWGPLEERKGFGKVIFVWEHTELTNPEAVRFSLDSIERKCNDLKESVYFKEKYGGFRLVEKSDLILEGTPEGRLPNLLRGPASETRGASALAPA